MEVHHHTHHPKRWKEYFWEFFMLFLAVFCGFLAEYQLEHKIENDRAKELAKSFYVELIEDSVRLNNIIELRAKREQSAKYLMYYFKNADLSLESDSAFRCMAFTFLTVSNRLFFEPSEGVLTQLQNSGSRRYFKSQQLQDAISKLASGISFFKLRNERELAFISEQCRPICLRHFDYFWLNEYLDDGKLSIVDAFIMNKQGPAGEAYFRKWQSIDRDLAVNVTGNLLLMYRGLNNSTIPPYRKAASETLRLLRQQFPFLDKIH